MASVLCRLHREFLGITIAALCLLAGCAAPAWQQLPPDARAGVVQTGFALRYVWRHPARHDAARPLIVILEGDGRPWLYATRIARNPTVDDPLLWNWFSQWSGQALYLGRPCYFAPSLAQTDPACAPYWYTNGRYSAAVVDSLQQALQRLAPNRPLVLLGHSGGGTLAMLLAPELPHACAVVTLAGNLNVAAWVRAHGYSPLTGSLDPAREPPLPPRIGQWHLYSTQDRTIQASWILAEARRQHAHAIAEPASSHDRGWRPFWPQLDRILEEEVLPFCRQSRSTGDR